MIPYACGKALISEEYESFTPLYEQNKMEVQSHDNLRIDNEDNLVKLPRVRKKRGAHRVIGVPKANLKTGIDTKQDPSLVNATPKAKKVFNIIKVTMPNTFG